MAKKSEDKYKLIKLSVFKKLIASSLKEDSKLRRHYKLDNPLDTSEEKMGKIARYISVYWNAVKKTFVDYWDLPSTRQRLTHGVGLYALTKLMGEIMADIDENATDAEDRIVERLEKIARIPWNHPEILSLQNIGRDKEALYNAIHDMYTLEEDETIEELKISISTPLGLVEKTVPLRNLN